MTDKNAMKLALDALETLMIERESIYEKAITALKERLAQEKALQALHNENERLGLYRDAYAEQEPPKYSFKAHWEKDGRIGVVGAVVRPDGGVHLLQDFIDPPQRTWVGLTDEEIQTTLSQLYCDINQMKFAFNNRPQKETVGFLFAKALEAKLKEKNT
jgi:hypothetical protein